MQFAPWALNLVEAAALSAGEARAGYSLRNQHYARTAARRLGDGASVVELDLNAPMLEVARSALGAFLTRTLPIGIQAIENA